MELKNLPGCVVGRLRKHWFDRLQSHNEFNHQLMLNFFFFFIHLHFKPNDLLATLSHFGTPSFSLSRNTV